MPGHTLEQIEALEHQVLRLIEAAGREGRTSGEVLYLLGRVPRDSEKGDLVLGILSMLSFKPASTVWQGTQQPDKPLVRLPCMDGQGVDGSDLTGQVAYMSTKNYFEQTTARKCPLCGQVLEAWELLGGNYSDESRIKVFRSALALCICETCFRTCVAGETDDVQPVGFAVLPSDMFHKSQDVSEPGVSKLSGKGRRRSHSAERLHTASMYSTVIEEMGARPVPFKSLPKPSGPPVPTRDRVLQETVHEVRKFGARGGTWHDIIETVRACLLPHRVENLKEVVQWSLHMSSSKTLKSKKPLLRRAMIGCDGCIQILFVAKDYIDPGSERLGLSSGTPSVQVEIAERQATPGASFGLRSFTTFRLLVRNAPELESPTVSLEGTGRRSGQDDHEILRRYSDFVWLREELVKWNGDKAMVPPLPRKKFLGRFSESFLESRVHALEHFMNIVATHPVLYTAEALHTFFRRGPIDQLKSEYESKMKALGHRMRHRRSSVTKLEGGTLSNAQALETLDKQALQRSLSDVSETVLPIGPNVAYLDVLLGGEPQIIDATRKLHSADYQKVLRSAYKAMERVAHCHLKQAIVLEQRAKALTHLAAVELPEIERLGGMYRTRSQTSSEIKSTVFSDVPLTVEHAPSGTRAVALLELLSTVSRLDLLSGTAHRATCIRSTGAKMQLKEWHRNLVVFSNWFESRGRTVQFLDKSIRKKQALLAEDHGPHSFRIKAAKQENEAAIREMSKVVDQSRKDAKVEACWVSKQSKKELVSSAITFVELQMEHARQMSRMWQDFLPQLLTSLEAKSPFSTNLSLVSSSESDTVQDQVITQHSQAASVAAYKPDEEDAAEGASSHQASLSDENFNQVNLKCASNYDWKRGKSPALKHPKVHDIKWEIDPKDLALGEIIGAGSFGRVYKGVFHGRPVAIKTFHADGLSAKAVEDLARETKVMRNLPPHPNLIKFFGACSQPENVCLVMELVQSGSLLDFLMYTPNSSSRAKQYSRQYEHLYHQAQRESNWRLVLALGAARGILALHSLSPQVLHRDIKTSNLLVTLPHLQVKVCDFGLARFKLEHQSVKSFVGTASWVAPEVILSREGYSAKADVYSFAIVLWQIYAQKKPYPNMHATQVLFSVARDGMRPKMPRSVPLSIRELICRCWEHDASSRPDFNYIVRQLSDGILHK